MHTLRNEVEKELRRRLGDRWVFLYWVGIPVVIGTIVTVGTGGSEGPQPVAELVVVDRDESLASTMLLASFEQGELKQRIRVDSVPPEIGEERVRQGEASALLIVPPGFGEAVLRDQPTSLTLKTNPAQTVLPRIVEEVLSVEVDAVFYAHRVFGEELREIVDLVDASEGDGSRPDDEAITAISVRVNRVVEQVVPYLLPPAIEVELQEDPVRSERETSFAFLFFPGILLMSVLLISEGLSGDVWNERESGTLSRMMSTPHGLKCYLTGKLVVAGLIYLVISGLLLAAGFFYHGLSFTKLPLAACWLVLAGCSLYLVMLAIQLSCPTRKSAGLFATLILFPLMMLGGSFFPFETMPAWMAAIGKWSPNGMMLEQLKRYLLDRHTLDGMLAVAAVVVVGSCVLLVVATAMIRRSFAK